jgi:hypothetical protein
MMPLPNDDTTPPVTNMYFVSTVDDIVGAVIKAQNYEKNRALPQPCR